MSRYSKIDRRIHSDAKFRSLSHAQPCGRYLWLYLLTTPKLTSIPGLIAAGEAELAEALEWSLKGFREGFAELFAKGLAKADWEARLVWIPNARKYNQPENPNVIKGWRTAWDEMPECGLKLEAWQGLKGLAEGLGEGFAKAFIEGLPEPFAEPFAKPVAVAVAVARTKRSAQSAPTKNAFDPLAIQLPEWLSVELWQKWATFRKERRAPLTAISCRQQIQDLTIWRSEGHDIAKIIDYSVRGGYQGLFEPKGAPGNGSAGSAYPPEQPFVQEPWDEIQRAAGLID